MKNLTIQKGMVCMTQAEFERLQAHLTRTDLERAVLDACADLGPGTIEALKVVGHGAARIARAELARRAVKS